MRQIISIFLSLLFSVSCYSQNKIDSLLFERINQYRDSARIPRLIWHHSVFQAAEHHSVYMAARNKVGKDSVLQTFADHVENKKVKEVEKLRTLQHRMMFYVAGLSRSATEVINLSAYEVPLTKAIHGHEIDIQEEDVVNEIIEQWFVVSKNKEKILDRNFRIGACSVIPKQIIYGRGASARFIIIFPATAIFLY